MRVLRIPMGWDGSRWSCRGSFSRIVGVALDQLSRGYVVPLMMKGRGVGLVEYVRTWVRTRKALKRSDIVAAEGNGVSFGANFGFSAEADDTRGGGVTRQLASKENVRWLVTKDSMNMFSIYVHGSEGSNHSDNTPRTKSPPSAYLAHPSQPGAHQSSRSTH